MSEPEKKLDVENDEGDNYQIDFVELHKASLTLDILNNKIRHQIFQVIQEDGPIPASEIQFKLELQQFEVEEHLAVLRKVDFVHIEFTGNILYYSINEQKINSILNLMVLHTIS